MLTIAKAGFTVAHDHMDMEFGVKLRRASLGRRLSLTILLGVSVLAAYRGAPVGSSPVPNRTLPKVEPPRANLEFPAQPSTEDVYRSHVFEEPLVPVGGEPSSAENAALAAALLNYARRTGPDIGSGYRRNRSASNPASSSIAAGEGG